MTTPTTVNKTGARISGKADRTKTLGRVRKLVAQAEHPDTDPSEADKYRALADALMLEYAIEEAHVRDAAPAAVRQTPKSVRVGMGLGGEGAMSWVSGLARAVAKHCRVIIGPGYAWSRDLGEFEATVYGWSGDIDYFEVMYTTLRLHMLGVLLPKPDATKGLGMNMYALHSAGYDWREVAGFYGWKLTEARGVIFRHETTGEERRYASVVGEYRKAYLAECERIGEQPTTIHHSETYREDASHGYVNQIDRRLKKLANSRAKEGEVILMSAFRDLEDFMREQNAEHFTRCPHCEKLSAWAYTCDRCGEKIADAPVVSRGRGRGGYAGRSRELNMTAYGAGVRHANTADLGGGVGTGRKSELGG